MTEFQIKLIIAVISSTLGGFLVHILYYSKLRMEQKSKIIGELTSRRIEAVCAVREFIKQLGIFEYLSITHPPEEEEARKLERHDFTEHQAIYPSIMENRESLVGFTSDLNQMRARYDEWLDLNSSAHLLYASQYCLEVIRLAALLNDEGEDNLYKVGAILIGDIQKWQTASMILLTKAINNPPMKSYPRSGRRWERKKKKVEKKFAQFLLYKIMHDIEVVNVCNTPECKLTVDDVIRIVYKILDIKTEEAFKVGS